MTVGSTVASAFHSLVLRSPFEHVIGPEVPLLANEIVVEHSATLGGTVAGLRMAYELALEGLVLIVWFGMVVFFTAVF